MIAAENCIRDVSTPVASALVQAQLRVPRLAAKETVTQLAAPDVYPALDLSAAVSTLGSLFQFFEDSPSTLLSLASSPLLCCRP